MQNANQTKRFKCSVCPKEYSRLDTLRAHERDHHGSQSDKTKVICLTCQKQFSSRQKLRRHEAIHSKARQYKCSHCSKVFKRSDNLKAHEESHEDADDEIECEYENCRKRFRSILAYKRHQRRYTDEKYVAPENQLQCNACVSRSKIVYKSRQLQHRNQISLLNH